MRKHKSDGNQQNGFLVRLIGGHPYDSQRMRFGRVDKADWWAIERLPDWLVAR